MARSSGTYSLPAGQPVVVGTTISDTVFNTLTADIANEITNSLPRDGTAPPTANLPMGNYKITGLGNGSVVTDAVAFGQLASYLSLTGGSLTGAIETKRATIVATATTTPLWTTANGNIQDWTGTPTITDFPAATQAGSQRVVYPAANTIITNAGNISVQGNATYTVSSGDELTITAITTTTFYVTIKRKDGTATNTNSKIQPITASVGSNALTVTINPTTLDFRSSTLTSGTVNTRIVSAAISMVVSSGSTLGTTNAIQSRLAVLAIDNAGTVEVAVVNIAGGVDLSETGLISTTAEGGAGAADSINVIYSTTARTSVPYRVVGYIESTQATAGTWATAPSTIQGWGGQVVIKGASMVRLNTANGYGSTNTKIRRFTNTVTNQGSDITYADSATLGASFTINTNGVYAISYNDQFSASGDVGISLNSSQLTTNIGAITVSDVVSISTTSASANATTAGATLYLPSGSVIRAHTSGFGTGASLTSVQFTITRVA